MDVYESLRASDPFLLDRIVVMTGGAFTAQARQFVAEVNAPVIEKPFETGQLRTFVDTLLGKGAPADAASSQRKPSAAETST